MSARSSGGPEARRPAKGLRYNLDMLRPRLLLVAAFFALTSPLTAQYMERVDVSVANIDVVVTDRQGNVVRGLTKDDFQIFENGVRQTITNFSAFDAPLPQKEAEATETTIEEQPSEPSRRRRLVVLFVDVDDVDPNTRRRFFSGVRRFVDSTVREGDAVTVLTWAHRIRIALPPTSSRAAVDAVLDALSGLSWSETELARRLSESRIREAEIQEALAASTGLQPATTAAEEAAFQEWLRGEERCAKLTRKLGELRNMLVSLSRAELQKIVIFASDDVSLNPGGGCVTAGSVDALSNTANAYGITIHALHPPGARDRFIGPDQGGFLPKSNAPAPGSTDYERAFDESGGLLWLARETGGRAAVGPSQSAETLRQVALESDTYYSLGYRLSAGNEDRPRTVKVTTKNRAYRVRNRSSVVRLSEASMLRDLVTTNLYLPQEQAVQFPRFRASIRSSKREGRFLLLEVEVAIPAVELALKSEKERIGSFSVYVAAGRELGDASEVTEMRHDFQAPAEEGKTLGSRFTTRVRPDTRRLSIAVRDNVSGSVATTVIGLAAD